MTPHPGSIVSTQPSEDVWNYENDWSSGCSDCCTNGTDCCFAFFCFPCFSWKLFRRTGECGGTPCCAPMALMALRAKVRTGFRIRGSICNDCICSVFCPMCIALQTTRELSFQGL